MSYNNTVEGRRAVLYRKIAAVYDSVEQEFELVKLLEMAGIRRNNHNLYLASQVLFEVFKCVKVVRKYGPIWKKPC